MESLDWPSKERYKMKHISELLGPLMDELGLQRPVETDPKRTDPRIKEDDRWERVKDDRDDRLEYHG